MGRLKKDHSGYRTSGLWIKYQHPKISEGVAKHKPKKNRAKWCRGKVGVKHNVKLIKTSKFLSYEWTEYRCVVCGKKIFS